MVAILYHLPSSFLPHIIFDLLHHIYSLISFYMYKSVSHLLRCHFLCAVLLMLLLSRRASVQLWSLWEVFPQYSSRLLNSELSPGTFTRGYCIHVLFVDVWHMFVDVCCCLLTFVCSNIITMIMIFAMIHTVLYTTGQSWVQAPSLVLQAQALANTIRSASALFQSFAKFYLSVNQALQAPQHKHIYIGRKRSVRSLKAGFLVISMHE